MAEAFVFDQRVLFKHCDPAGIVFYPRYFEIMNDCIEAFFTQVVNWPFETLHRSGSVPTADIHTRFIAPSRHGDHLSIGLSLTRLGRTSMSYAMQGRCRDEARFETAATLVHVNTHGRPEPWPDDIRPKLEELSP